MAKSILLRVDWSSINLCVTGRHVRDVLKNKVRKGRRKKTRARAHFSFSFSFFFCPIVHYNSNPHFVNQPQACRNKDKDKDKDSQIRADCSKASGHLVTNTVRVDSLMSP